MIASVRFGFFLIFLFEFGVFFSDSSTLPSFIKPCHRSDPNVQECILNEGRRIMKRFAEGIPEMGVASMDPLNVGDVEFLSGSNGGLKLTQQNVVITGFKNTNLKELRFNDVNKTGRSHITGDIVWNSNYTIDGRLLLFPIKGEGECIIKMKDCDLQLDYDWKLYKGKDGKEYAKMVSQRSKFDIGKAHIKMTGLFNNDKVLGENMNQLLNMNSAEIMKELEQPSIKAVEKRTKKIFNDFFKQIPFDEILPV